MKLQQLRYIHEVARQNLNISAAAEILYTSQPGVSKQIQLLEEELGLQIFQRNGKRLSGITKPGEAVLKLAAQVLLGMQNIKQVGEEFSRVDKGVLTIATTHTQARYKLPKAVQQFMQLYPNVKLHIKQGNPTQVTNWVATGEADIGIATETISLDDRIACLPCYEWNRCVVVPHDHALLSKQTLTLEDIAAYPLVTYDYAFTGSTTVSKVFHEAGLEPNVVLAAIDSDVIKTYVSLGLGIGLIANMAYDEVRDANLNRIDCAHLFPVSTTYLGMRKDAFLRDYSVKFMQLLAPEITHEQVGEVLETP